MIKFVPAGEVIADSTDEHMRDDPAPVVPVGPAFYDLTTKDRAVIVAEQKRMISAKRDGCHNCRSSHAGYCTAREMEHPVRPDDTCDDHRHRRSCIGCEHVRYESCETYGHYCSLDPERGSCDFDTLPSWCPSKGAIE